MKPAMLFGCGANRFEIPCMLFESIEAGEKFVNELLGIQGERNADGVIFYDFDYYTKVKTSKFEREQTIIPKADLQKFIEEHKNVVELESKVVETLGRKLLQIGEHCFCGMLNGTKPEDCTAVEYDEEVICNYGEIIAEKIFTSYYDGCGGIYNYYLTEVEFGEKLCGFSLD
jgi:hypothetical protein